MDNKDAFVVGVFGDVYQGSLEIDPRAFAAAIMSLAIAALAASAIPARRAATVDPVVALRAE